MSSAVKMWVLFLLAVCQITRSSALSCPCWWDKPTPEDPRTYREKHCDLALTCPPEASVVPDACGCCDVCSKVEGDVCAGPWYVMGHCSDGYACIDPRTNETVKSIMGNLPAGNCQKIPPKEERPVPAAVNEGEELEGDDPEVEATAVTLVQDATAAEADVTEALTTEQPRRRKNRKDRKDRKDRKRNGKGKKHKGRRMKLGKQGKLDRKNEITNLLSNL